MYRHNIIHVLLLCLYSYRLSYAVYLIDSLIGKHESSTEIFAMYDIACSLQKYFKVCLLCVFLTVLAIMFYLLK